MFDEFDGGLVRENNDLQATKLLQMGQDVGWNFSDAILLQASESRKAIERAHVTLPSLQFNRCIWNISRDFHQVLVFAVDHAVETCTRIRTDGHIARVFDVVGICWKKAWKSTFSCERASPWNCTHAAALLLIVDQRDDVFVGARVSVLASRVEAKKGMELEILGQPEETAIADELIVMESPGNVAKTKVEDVRNRRRQQNGLVSILGRRRGSARAEGERRRPTHVLTEPLDRSVVQVATRAVLLDC